MCHLMFLRRLTRTFSYSNSKRPRVQISQKTLTINELATQRSSYSISFASASSQSSTTTQQSLEYCRDFVKKYDRDSYLINMFCPKSYQDAFFAVRAFYIELAMIQDSVSNSMLGQMRMQFWKDAITAISEGRPPHHPISLALSEAQKYFNIPVYHLKRIVDARNDELTSSTHMSMETLINHAESTSCTLNYLFLSILNLTSSDALAHAASHLGISQTMVVLLRALPYHASKGRMIIPSTLTAKHSVSQNNVFRHGPAAQGLEDAVFEFAVEANSHLLTARELFNRERQSKVEVSRGAMPVFLGAVSVSNYLSRLEKANFNAYDPKLQIRDNLRIPWKIWLSHWRNQI